MVHDGEDLVAVLDGAVDDGELVDLGADILGEQQARADTALAETDRIGAAVVVAARRHDECGSEHVSRDSSDPTDHPHPTLANTPRQAVATLPVVAQDGITCGVSRMGVVGDGTHYTGADERWDVGVLDLIDESLEAFFRATVPLDATDVDVSFEPPEREWSAKLNRPTVNAFLWDIRRSTHRARTGMEAFSATARRFGAWRCRWSSCGTSSRRGHRTTATSAPCSPA